MKKAYLATLFILILGVSAVGLLALLPFLKEGSSWSELPFFAAVAAAALLLGFFWWLAVGRSLPMALVGWSVLLLPLLGHGWLAGALIYARFEGERLAREVRIENYEESPIFWPGFDGPVGLALSLELSHPTGIEAAILPPEIRMGPQLEIPRDKLAASLRSGSGYFKSTYLEQPAGDLTLLKSVLFQRIFENPATEEPIYKWSSAARFADADRTSLTYFLLPGTLDYLPERSRICLNSRSFGVAACAKDQKPETGCRSPNARPVLNPVYFDGGDLSAIWMAAGANDMTADLSRLLTETLRSRSALQSDPEAWQAIQKRMEPAGLEKAGYGLCPAGTDSHTRFRACFCKAG